MGNTGFEKAFINRTNAGNGITVWNWRGGVCCPAFFAISQKIFEMSELCNNSACFFVEIKGTSDIYSSSKSLMIILPFMEEAICYCNMGISRASAYELVHTPGFPAFRRGRLIKVSKIAFFEWMAKGSETVPGSDK